jgi:hypothetical protein
MKPTMKSAFLTLGVLLTLFFSGVAQERYAVVDTK